MVRVAAAPRQGVSRGGRGEDGWEAVAAVGENAGSHGGRGGSCGGKAVAEAVADKWPAILRV